MLALCVDKPPADHPHRAPLDIPVQILPARQSAQYDMAVGRCSPHREKEFCHRLELVQLRLQNRLFSQLRRQRRAAHNGGRMQVETACAEPLGQSGRTGLGRETVGRCHGPHELQHGKIVHVLRLDHFREFIDRPPPGQAEPVTRRDQVGQPVCRPPYHPQERLLDTQPLVRHNERSAQPEPLRQFQRQPVRRERRRGQRDADQTFLARFLKVVHHRGSRNAQRFRDFLLVAAVLIIHPRDLDHGILAADLPQIAPPCQPRHPRSRPRIRPLTRISDKSRKSKHVRIAARPCLKP